MEGRPTRTDNMVTHQTERTNDQRILRRCSYGWSKLTTYHGLRIYQGETKCIGNCQPQTHTALAGQTKRYHSQVEHHSASDPNLAVGTGEEHQSSQHISQQQQKTPQQEHHFTSSTPTGRPPEKYAHKPNVKWPKVSDREAWRNFDKSLCSTLQIS